MKKVAIIPQSMHNIVERAGYLPAIRVGNLLVMSGQVGRDAQLAIPADPEQQFRLCWDNLALVLAEAGCTFEDVIDMTTYHVNMSTHMPVFRQVKNERFPLATCCWTCIGVSELAHPGLLVEIKLYCIDCIITSGTNTAAGTSSGLLRLLTHCVTS